MTEDMCALTVFDGLDPEVAQREAESLTVPLPIEWRGGVSISCATHKVIVIAPTREQADELIRAHLVLVDAGQWGDRS
jgi:hypothetical protein